MGDRHDERRRSSADQARALEVFVVEDRRQWHVEMVVVFDDEVVRRRVGTYWSEQRARTAANLIKATADRDISGPLHG